MPAFAAVRCRSCLTYQVQQAKQTLKWKCGICGELQTVEKASRCSFDFEKNCSSSFRRSNLLPLNRNEKPPSLSKKKIIPANRST